MEDFFTWWNLIFIIPFLGGFLFLVLQVLGLGEAEFEADHDVDHDFDHDIDHDMDQGDHAECQHDGESGYRCELAGSLPPEFFAPG